MNTKFTKKEKVIFTFNYKTVKKTDLQKVTNFADDFDGGIHLLFETETDGLPGTQPQIFNKLFIGGIPDFSFEMIFFSKNQFLREVMDYSNEIDADIIIGNNPTTGIPGLLISGKLSESVIKELELEIPSFYSTIAKGFPHFEFNYN